MNYRERCYRAYISSHWKGFHDFSPAEYEFHRGLYRAHYLAVLPPDRGAAILDVACGAGHFLHFLKTEGYTAAAGIDVSPEQIAQAKLAGVSNVTRADCFSFLPRRKAQYDLIVAHDLVEHLTKAEILAVLDLMFAALRPGGRILLSTENAASLFGMARKANDFTHETGLTAMSLKQVLEVAGFAGPVVRGLGPWPYDGRSRIRAWLWAGLRGLLKVYLAVEVGRGRGGQQAPAILEPRIFAVAEKPAGKPATRTRP